MLQESSNPSQLSRTHSSKLPPQSTKDSAVGVGQLRPSRKKILIRRFEDPARVGLLWIPDTVIERPQKGQVISVGSEVEGIYVNDCVLFQPWADSQFLRLSMDEDHLAAITENIVIAKVFFSRNNKLIIHPYKDRVGVIPAQPKESTASGLYVHVTKEDELWIPFGEIVSKGWNCTDELNIGDRVIIPQRGGVTVDVSTSDRAPKLYKFGLFIFKENEILARLT